MMTKKLSAQQKLADHGKKRVRKHVISEMSEHHLGYLVVSCDYTFATVQADYGYDATVNTFDHLGENEAGYFLIQLKATDKLTPHKRTGIRTFSVSKRDIKTWENETFPVYLVVFDVPNEKAYWVYLQRHFRNNGISSATMTKKSVAVRLSSDPVDRTAIRGWRADKNGILEQIGAVDHD